MLIVGIDFATTADKVGIAVGDSDGHHLRIESASLCATRSHPASIISGLLRNHAVSLLAIDAPLGWPVALASNLSAHSAGEPIEVEPDDLFSRSTDRFVRDQIGKKPLDVGADRIARTAHAALRLLGDLRQSLQERIPLAWSSTGVSQTSAIEVYPAATLTAHGFRATGYKKPEETEARAQILEQLKAVLDPPAATTEIIASADVLDAVVCVLAGHDFLRRLALDPAPDDPLAVREGWIWVARPVRAGGRASAPSAASQSRVETTPVASAASGTRRCPACGVKEFKAWPAGWDAHAAHACSGVSGSTAEERKAAFKARFLSA
jgi:hypothetical protein